MNTKPGMANTAADLIAWAIYLFVGVLIVCLAVPMVLDVWHNIQHAIGAL